LVVKKLGFGRRCLAIAAALALFVTGLLPAVADAQGPSNKAVFVIGQRAYQVNGEVREMDAEPFIETGRTFVPLRYLAYALGATEKDVGWDPAAMMVTLKFFGTRTLQLTVGNKVMVVDGGKKYVTMDVTPLLRNGRSYLPARWVAEELGYKVDWVPEKQAVLVYPPGQAPPEVKIGTQNQFQGPVSWSAVKAGTLAPPPGAKDPPSIWGFPSALSRIETAVSSRTARVFMEDGSSFTIDLGTPVVVIGPEMDIKWLREKYPAVYNSTNTMVDASRDQAAVFIPIVPIIKAAGFPEENIVWDGQHLVLFGFDGSKRGYKAWRTGDKEVVARWSQRGEGAVTSTWMYFTPIVRDSMLMVGKGSVSDIETFFIGAASFSAVRATCKTHSKQWINKAIMAISGILYLFEAIPWA
jgi:hypothetical protein